MPTQNLISVDQFNPFTPAITELEKVVQVMQSLAASAGAVNKLFDSMKSFGQDFVHRGFAIHTLFGGLGRTAMEALGLGGGGHGRGVPSALGAGLNVAGEVFQKSLLVAGTAAEAASPDVMSTFMGSIKLAAAELGTVLVPLFIRASEVIQDFAFNLSEATQGRWAGGLTRDLVGMSQIREKYFENLTPEKVEETEQYKKRFAAFSAKDNPLQTIEESIKLNRDLQTGQAEVRDQWKEISDRPGVFWSHAISYPFRSGGLFGLSEKEMADRKSKGAEKQIQSLGEQEAELQVMRWKFGGAIPDLPGIGKKNLLKNSLAELLNVQGLLTNVVSGTPPGYYDPEAFYKKIQLQALTQTPLEEEIKRIQLQQLDELLKSNSYLSKLAEESGYTVPERAK